MVEVLMSENKWQREFSEEVGNVVDRWLKSSLSEDSKDPESSTYPNLQVLLDGVEVELSRKIHFVNFRDRTSGSLIHVREISGSSAKNSRFKLALRFTMLGSCDTEYYLNLRKLASPIWNENQDHWQIFEPYHSNRNKTVGMKNV